MIYILCIIAVPFVSMLISYIIAGELTSVLSTILIFSLVTIYYINKLRASASEDRECYYMLYNCIDFPSMERKVNKIQKYRIEYEELRKRGDKITRKERTRANLLFEVLTELGEDIKYFDIAVLDYRYPHKYTRHLGR